MYSMDEALRRFEKCSATEPFALLVPMTCSLAEAEKALGITFPPSYRDFLSKRTETSIPARDIVEENRASREATGGFCLPGFLVAFFHDGMANEYCFDTRTADEAGEHPVVFWDHELSTEENLAAIVATDKSFGEWLLRYPEELPEKARRFGGAVFVAGCLVVLGILAFLVTVGVRSVVKWLWR